MIKGASEFGSEKTIRSKTVDGGSKVHGTKNGNAGQCDVQYKVTALAQIRGGVQVGNVPARIIKFVKVIESYLVK